MMAALPGTHRRIEINSLFEHPSTDRRTGMGIPWWFIRGTCTFSAVSNVVRAFRAVSNNKKGDLWLAWTSKSITNQQQIYSRHQLHRDRDFYDNRTKNIHQHQQFPSGSVINHIRTKRNARLKGKCWCKRCEYFIKCWEDTYLNLSSWLQTRPESFLTGVGLWI